LENLYGVGYLFVSSYASVLQFLSLDKLTYFKT
jgi:hypothetical protein